MERTHARFSRRQVFGWLLLPVCVAGLIVAISCNTNVGGGGGTSEPPPETGVDQILNLKSQFPVSGRGQLTIQYTVPPPATISAFYVPVESATPGAPDKGPSVTFAEGLPAGTSQSVNLRWDDIPVGTYQIGLTIVRAGVTKTVRSSGWLVIEAPPDPIILQPSENKEIDEGQAVSIAFNNRKTPSTRVRWRLGYVRYNVLDSDHDGVLNALDQCPGTNSGEGVDGLGCSDGQKAAGDDFDGDGVSNNADLCPGTEVGAHVDTAGCSLVQLGAQIDAGDGNEADATWETNGVAHANYWIVLSATDTGSSVNDTFVSDSSRVVTVFSRAIISIGEPPPPPTPPLLAFVTPAKDIATFLTETVTVQFDVTIRNAGATGKLKLFLDRDNVAGNGNELSPFLDIADAESVSSASFSTANVNEGLYYIGGTVDDDVSPPVSVYAVGRVDVVKTPTLAVTDPNTPLPVRPQASVEVKWTTNVPAHAGDLGVYARRVNEQGNPEGEPFVIRAAGPPLSGSDSDAFLPPESGVWRVFVQLDFDNNAHESLIMAAPKDLRVSTLPPVVWLGTFALAPEDDSKVDGLIMGGANFEDNIGTHVKSVSDLNGDSKDELLFDARYGKPGFKNPNGVGEGEAYLLYGGAQRLTGERNANEIGKGLVGIVLTGIRTRGEPANREQTQGMSSIEVIPDLDGDELPELVFGFSRTRSRGHNISPLQDGLTPDPFLTSLERANQFLRGGIVIVSSKNTNLRFPDDSRLSPVIRLDLVGQQFQNNFPAFAGYEECAFDDIRSPDPCYPECMCDLVCPDHDDGTPGECPPEPMDEDTCQDYCGVETKCSEVCGAEGDSCWGNCICPHGGEDSADGLYDAMTFEGSATGFVGPLADTWYERYYCGQNWDCGRCVGSMTYPLPVCNYIYDPFTCADPLHQNNVCRRAVCYPYKPIFSDVGLAGQSGFYPTTPPIEPLGARVIGISTYGGLNDGDHFGTSMTISNSNNTGPSELIVTAPDRRQAIPTLGIVQGQCVERGVDGEVNNMNFDANNDGCPDPVDFPGMAYMINFEVEDVQGRRLPYNLWENDPFGRIPPKPHQYMVGTISHCDLCESSGRIDNPETIRIIGQANERLKNILGVDDFNGDGRNDLAAGNPEANGGKGHVYVAYRREKRLEGDYVLGKLALAPADPNRLDGIFIVWGGSDAANFGASLATGMDFNHDGLSDLVIGAPNASVSTDTEGQTAEKVGAVVIVFSNPTLITPAGGITVEELVRTGRAVKLVGNFLDTQGSFGFNVAPIGDIDNDGQIELGIAAPGASPRFDPTPSDAVDLLTDAGLDLDFDGRRDDIAKDFNLPGFDNTMARAGVVYVISGANDFAGNQAPAISVRMLGSDELRGMIVAGRRGRDFLGGGDAGDANMGGNAVKATRGRGFGLGSAGDMDGDGKGDFAIGALLADPRRDRITGEGVTNGGEVYFIYGGTLPGM